TTMRWILLCLSFLAGCGGDTVEALGQVRYKISERPLASGKAGSCMPSSVMEYSENAAFFATVKYAIGSAMEVDVLWPDRRDCTSDGILGPTHCPKVDADFIPLGAGVWSNYFTSARPAQSFILSLEARNEGEGGFKTVIHGKDIDPPFNLKVGRASGIRFEQSRDSRYGDVIPGAITEIHVARGSGNTIFAATLRDSSGEHICGAVPA